MVQQSIFQKVKDYWGEDDDEATGFCMLLFTFKPGRSWKCVCVCLLLGNKYVIVRLMIVDIIVSRVVFLFMRLSSIFPGSGCGL